MVEVDGVQECPRQADAGNELTEAVEDWIFRNNSFTDCSIVGGYRTVCEATGGSYLGLASCVVIISLCALIRS